MVNRPHRAAEIPAVTIARVADVTGDRGLGERLAIALKRRGMSQGQLEAAAGLGDSYVSKLLQGKRPNVGFQTLEDISIALKVNYLWLAFGVGPMEGNAPTRTIHYDERYPNLTDAVIAARALKYSEAAIARARDRALSGDDPPPALWFKRIEVAEDEVRREELALPQDVAREAKRREADARRAAEMEQLTKPKLPKRRG